MKTAGVKIRTRFPLAAVPAALEIIPMPDSVTMMLPIDCNLFIAERDTVVAGQPLCKEARNGMFAPFEGTVSLIRKIGRGSEEACIAVSISKSASAAGIQEKASLHDANSSDGAAARECAGRLGIRLPEENTSCLIMLVDEDIPSVANRWVLEKEPEKITTGLAYLKKIFAEQKIYIALPETTSDDRKKVVSEYGTLLTVKNCYPDSRADIIIRQHIAQNDHNPIVVIDGYRMAVLADMFSAGHPQHTTLIALRYDRKEKVRLLQVPVGMHRDALLEKAGCAVHVGDQVIIGGEFTGTACCDISRPVAADDTALLIIPSGEAVLSENQSCVRCGRCVTACPVGLRVDSISVCVELRRLEDAEELGIDRCIDCGICAAVCSTRRPLAHLMKCGKAAVAGKTERHGGK